MTGWSADSMKKIQKTSSTLMRSSLLRSFASDSPGEGEAGNAAIGIARPVPPPRRQQQAGKNDAGDESADVSPPGDTAFGERGEPFRRSLQYLDQKPQSDEHSSRQFKEQGNEKDRNHDDDSREREQTQITTKYPSDCAGGAQRRDRRGRIECRMGYRRQQAAGKIKRQIGQRAQLILDRPAEQPQCPHVENQVQPTTVQEHVADKRQIIGRGHRAVEAAGIEIARWDQSVAVEEQVEL